MNCHCLWICTLNQHYTLSIAVTLKLTVETLVSVIVSNRIEGLLVGVDLGNRRRLARICSTSNGLVRENRGS